MWKITVLASVSTVFLARGQTVETCCGADCQVQSDSPAPGCNTAHTILDDSLDEVVTQADTMGLDTIRHEGYQDMYNASCASGFHHQVSNLTVSTVVFDCAGLCPLADYGQHIFNACCAECVARDTSADTDQTTVAFSHCKGCNRTGVSVAETPEAFHTRIVTTLHDKITAWVTQETSTSYSTPLGSSHDGAWHTDLRSGVLEAGNMSALPIAGLTTGATSQTALANQRRLQEAQTALANSQAMFYNSYGYNTRCAAGIPGDCQANFSLKLVDCLDCHGVPILTRACCRDCGCALDQEAENLQSSGAGNYVHLQCAGCSCSDATTGIEAWVDHYISTCHSDPLQAVVTARFYVHGQIPLTFQNAAVVTSILTNPNAHTVIAEAIAEIAQVNVASTVTVALTAGNQSGLINAVLDIASPSESAARAAEAHIEAETTDTAQTVVNSHLHLAGIESAVNVGAIQTAPLGAPQRLYSQETMLQANLSPATPSSSKTWLPTVLGTAVAMGLAVFVVVMFLNSAQAVPKNRSQQEVSFVALPTAQAVSVA